MVLQFQVRLINGENSSDTSIVAWLSYISWRV